MLLAYPGQFNEAGRGRAGPEKAPVERKKAPFPGLPAPGAFRTMAALQDPTPGSGLFPRSKTMYAVIESGGKQHRVVEGEVLKLELLEAATGDTINFDKVLMVGQGADVKIGAPYVASGKVTAEVLAHGRADKVKIIKFKRRKHYRKQQGHRQWFTKVKITGISA